MFLVVFADSEIYYGPINLINGLWCWSEKALVEARGFFQKILSVHCFVSDSLRDVRFSRGQGVDWERNF